MTKNEELYLKAKEAYYNGKPIMSDKEFDKLEDKLRSLNSTVINIVGTPKGMSNERVKFKHLTPMLSLSKITADKSDKAPTQEFAKWWKKVGQPKLMEVTPKYDGNAVSLQYVNGKLSLALTRGDGKEGQDITNKVKNLVPSTINLKDTVEIRGEMLMPLDTFNKKYLEFKNPRNLVAGILAHKTIDWNMVNDLHYIPYEIKVLNGKGDYDYFENVITFLTVNKFKHLPNIKFVEFENLTKDFELLYNEKLKERKKSIYQLDGLVVKVFNSSDRKRLGETSHHPEWGLAIKHSATQTVTTIEDIIWTMGRTGEFAPVACLTPVDLDGSTVSRCSLYNYGYIIRESVYPGAVVAIAKRGDIIPGIEAIIEPSKLKTYKFPTVCPHCGSKLVKDDIRISCPNKSCSGLLQRKFVKAVELLEMDFFGEKTVEKIFEAGIENVIDIFDSKIFNKKNLINTGYFKAGKSLDRLIYQVNQVKEIPLWKVICLLGIDNLGETASKQIAKMISGQEYSDFGLQKEFFDMFKTNTVYNKELKSLLKSFETSGITITTEKVKNTMTKKSIDFVTVEMTGSPKPFFATKEDFINEMAKYVEIDTDKLTKDSTYLVTDSYNSTSAKMAKAEKLGVEIITYEDFKKKYTC